MAHVTGDFSKLATLQDRLRQLSRAGLAREAAEVMGAEALKQLGDQFRSGRDPYGNPWRPPQLRSGQPLRDSGRMAASAFYRVEGSRLRVSLPVKYAITHQHGATIRPRSARALRFRSPRSGKVIFAREVTIPRRQIIPDRAGGLGPYWRDGFNRAASGLIRRRLLGEGAT